MSVPGVDQAPVGSRPFESLAAAVDRHEISMQGALAVAAEHGDAAADEAYVEELVARAVAALESGRLVAGLVLLDLVVAGLKARPGGAAGDVAGRTACLRFAEAARARLGEVADGRLFRRALTAAEAVLTWARATVDADALVEALLAVGNLRLHPLISGRRVFEPEREIALWQGDFRARFRHEIADLDEEEWRMPDTRDSVRTALAVLEEAAGMQQDAERARTLATCVAGGVLLLGLGEEIDRTALVARCLEAIDGLQSTDHAAELGNVIGCLAWLGEPVRREQVEALLSRSMDDLVRRQGWPAAAAMMGQLVSALAPADASFALQVARSARILFERGSTGDDALLEGYLANEIELLIRAYQGPEDMELANGPDIAAGAAALRAAAEREDWDVRRLAVNLVRLARRQEAIESEDGIGLQLLEEATEIAPVLAWDHDAAFRRERARLLVLSGREAGRRGAWNRAADWLVTGLHEAARLGVRREAMGSISALARTFDGLRRATATDAAAIEAVERIVVDLSGAALEVVEWLGAEAGDLVQGIFGDAIAVLADRVADTDTPQLIVPLLQGAKGRRFAVQLHKGSHESWRDEDSDGALLLREIAAEEARVVPDAGTELDEHLLVSYVADEAKPSDVATERLVNLYHAYDAHLNQRLLPEAGLKLPLITAGALQRMLDERTVLVDLYLDAKLGADLGIVAVAVTSEEVVPTVQRLDIPYRVQVAASARGRAFPASPFAAEVVPLRKELRKPPEPDQVTPTAADALGRHGNLFLGGLADHLERWAEAGKDHLCICPHGPLHVHPLHLCGIGGTLADYWIVTYVPNLYMVAPRGTDAMLHRPRVPMCSLGLSYTKSNPFGLAELPAAEREAREVAGIFGTEPVIDDDVTPASVLEAFTRAECVHLAAHGRHNVDAPAFQCLYLTPDGESDGRLAAHELLSTDMRATRILTLSACETALGRFDAGDNLRGLPACFLLAGVRTIIGTLWPVDTDASRLFFTRFYTGLNEGMALLDAFAAAQDATRAQFPAYRDWGPFYFMGDWF